MLGDWRKFVCTCVGGLQCVCVRVCWGAAVCVCVYGRRLVMMLLPAETALLRSRGAAGVQGHPRFCSRTLLRSR